MPPDRKTEENIASSEYFSLTFSLYRATINAIFLQGNSRCLFSAVNKTREGLIWILEQWQRLYSRK